MQTITEASGKTTITEYLTDGTVIVNGKVATAAQTGTTGGSATGTTGATPPAGTAGTNQG